VEMIYPAAICKFLPIKPVIESDLAAPRYVCIDLRCWRSRVYF
jgi:hypothetical protein